MSQACQPPKIRCIFNDVRVRSFIQKGDHFSAEQETTAPAVAALETATAAYLQLQRGSSARMSPVSNGWVRAANHSARAAARRRPRSSIGSFKTSSNE